MPQCPTCGATVTEQADVCPDCGMELNPSEAPLPAEAPEAAPPVETPSSGATPIEVSVEAAPAPVESVPAPAPSPAPAAGTASLKLKRSGILTGDVFPFSGRVIIGRFDPDSGPVDVDLGPLPEAAYISRRHSEISLNDAGQWIIKDLGSRNGTFVRGQAQDQFQRIAGDQPLDDGDEIALGNARFEFHIH
jgi:hypothetical protein